MVNSSDILKGTSKNLFSNLDFIHKINFFDVKSPLP